jgi:hypothetical protein
MVTVLGACVPMVCGSEDEGRVLLSRCETLLPKPTDASVIDLQEKTTLALFLGILFHAINTMGGKPKSILRHGFIPMVCYAMKQYLWALDNQRSLAQYILFINQVCKFAINNKGSDLTGASLVDNLMLVFMELGGVTGRLCMRLKKKCVSLKAIPLDQEFFDYMGTAQMKFEKQRESTPELLKQSPEFYIGLQIALYKAVVEANRLEWQGLVPYYIRFILGTRYPAPMAGDRVSFVWVAYEPLKDSFDFFSSPEFLECITQFTAHIEYVGEGDKAELKKEWAIDAAKMCEIVDSESTETQYTQLKQIADDQRGRICIGSAVFMNRLLAAYVLFLKRTDSVLFDEKGDFILEV